jgi:YtkA-like protein
MQRRLVKIPTRRLFATSLIALGAIILLVWLMIPGAVPPDLDLSRSKASEKGFYSVSIEPEAGSFKQGELHSWVISLRGADGAPVENATLTVDGGMPQHHHGLPTSPAVTAHLGDGRYRLEGVKFHMSGWWELRLAIETPAGADRATFNIVL